VRRKVPSATPKGARSAATQAPCCPAAISLHRVPDLCASFLTANLTAKTLDAGLLRGCYRNRQFKKWKVYNRSDTHGRQPVELKILWSETPCGFESRPGIAFSLRLILSRN